MFGSLKADTRAFRRAAAVVALFAALAEAKAEDSPRFFLNADGSVEERIANVENGQAKLLAAVAELEAKVAKLSGEKSKAAVGPVSPPASKIRFQTCANGRCTTGECDSLLQVPAGATILSAPSYGIRAAAPCPTGPCGDRCGCASVRVATSAAVGSNALLHRFRERRAVRVSAARGQ